MPSNLPLQELVKTVADFTRGEIESGDSDVWRNFEIPVPAVPPSHFRFCEYIDMKYELQVQLRMQENQLPHDLNMRPFHFFTYSS